MKKTLKYMLCIFLCTVMVLSSFSVFAFAEGDSFEWQKCMFEKCGEAKLGENSFSLNSDCIYFDFDVAEDGYYFITADFIQGNVYVGNISVPDYSDGLREEVKPSHYSYDSFINNDFEKYVFKLEEGCEKLLFELYSATDEEIKGSDIKFNISYMGREITDIAIKSNTDEDIILGADIYEWYDVDADENYSYEFYCDFEVVFDGQEKIVFNKSPLIIISEGEIVCGENEVKKTFLDYTETVVLSVKRFDDYIESVRVEGLENPCCIQYYDGGISGDYGISDDTVLIVTYKDGTEKTFTGETVTLVEGGREYYWYLAFCVEEDEASLHILINDELVGEIECDLINATFEENYEIFKQTLKGMSTIFISDISMAFNQISYAETPYEYLVAIKDAFEYTGYILSWYLRHTINQFMGFIAAM